MEVWYMDQFNEQDINNILKILDNFYEAGESRMKLYVDETKTPEAVQHDYHHGRYYSYCALSMQSTPILPRAQFPERSVLH